MYYYNVILSVKNRTGSDIETQSGMVVCQELGEREIVWFSGYRFRKIKKFWKANA